MKTRNELTGKLLGLIKEAENHGVDVAIYLAHIMEGQANQIKVRNARVPMVVKPVIAVEH